MEIKASIIAGERVIPFKNLNNAIAALNTIEAQLKSEEIIKPQFTPGQEKISLVINGIAIPDANVFISTKTLEYAIDFLTGFSK